MVSRFENQHQQTADDRHTGIQERLGRIQQPAMGRIKASLAIVQVARAVPNHRTAPMPVTCQREQYCNRIHAPVTMLSEPSEPRNNRPGCQSRATD
uniref:Uncharacterized protein n=1 Tax=Mycobacterium leprae TaxID=1769 RepID=O32887_MYCLR|nr:hypothetical protein MLCB1779.26 [Mycobacterium leprae]